MTTSELREIQELIELGFTEDEAYDMVMGTNGCDCEDYPCCGH